MTMDKDDYVTDKYGRRVRRNKDDVVKDGELLRVPMVMMDEQARTMRDAAAQLENHQLSAFADAVNGGMSLADAVAKAKGIRRVEQFDMKQHPQAARYGTRDEASEAARQKRDARVCDAWKNPPSVTKGDATPLEQVQLVGPSAPTEQLLAARDQAVANRDKRLENAWQR